MATARKSIPSQASKGIDLGNLPLELILSITDHLPPSSVACLALTCKDLYNSPPLKKIWTKGLDPVASPSRCYHEYYPCYPDDPTRNHERFQIIRQLKRDIPTHLFCDCCHNFHPKPKVDNTWRWLTCPSAPNKATWLSWPNFNFHLQFEDVQGVMNNHHYGKQHGVPIDSIAKTTDWTITMNAFKNPILCKLDVEPKIVNNNLVLHTTQRTFFTERQLRETPCFYLDPLDNSLDVFKMCKHQDVMSWKLRQVISNLTQHPDVRFRERGNGWRKSVLTSCDTCTTRYCIEMAHHADLDIAAEGLEISLHTWMNLGRCGHNFSPCWLDMSERRGIQYPGEIIEKAKKISVHVFRTEVSSAISAQYAQIRPPKTQQHPSLLPAIDTAVFAENNAYLSKYNEITKILKEARQNIRDIPMEIVAECELNHLPRRVLTIPEEVDAVKRARSIIHDHELRILASRSRWEKVKAGLYRVFVSRRTLSTTDMFLLIAATA